MRSQQSSGKAPCVVDLVSREEIQGGEIPRRHVVDNVIEAGIRIFRPTAIRIVTPMCWKHVV